MFAGDAGFSLAAPAGGVGSMTSAFQHLATGDSSMSNGDQGIDLKQLAKLAATLDGSDAASAAAGAAAGGSHSHGLPPPAGPVARAPIFVWSRHTS